VDAVFCCLRYDFLTMPKGEGFVEYPTFEEGYEALKQATASFARIEPENVVSLVFSKPICLVVLRTMLGFTPPEWADVVSDSTDVRVTQGFARSLDRQIRKAPLECLGRTDLREERITALVQVASEFLTEGAPDLPQDELHRLAKVDTSSGSGSLQHVASHGVPYAMLLYERYLGRPYAAHRDSVSELIGGVLEAAVEDRLQAAGVSFRKTKRAEKVEGFDRAPDFVVPSEFNPRIAIEAKLTLDDGTARDKVTRIQHLAELGAARKRQGEPGFQVIACIDGRGFAVRRGDMEKMLLATGGKVFTLETMDRLVDCSALRQFRTT
jgi:hypothetical protein